ncbi:hypothetical protein LIER_16926 [Lithospermum erythrorhizon]|uniref:Uncharacterized protein n=1 Tax=Lithospermum erythrorhizon TaxID=34254 RepID=A0AAV3QB27_LITER
MVKPRTEEASIDSGGSILDEKLQSVVAEWRQNDSSHAGCVHLVASKNSTVALDSRPHIVEGSIGAGLVAPQSGDGGQIAPQSGDGIALGPGNLADVHNDGGDKIQSVPVVRPSLGSGHFPDGSNGLPLAGECLVFKAGGSGVRVAGKPAASSARSSKSAGMVQLRVKHGQSRGCGAIQGNGLLSNCTHPPTPLPNRPEAADPSVVPDVPHEGVKCPKNVKVDNAPVVSLPVVPPPAPHDNPVPDVPPMVTRSKARVKTRSVALSKDPSPKECVDGSVAGGSLSGVNVGIPKVEAQLLKGKGLKGVGKAKTAMAQVPVVSPNSFDVLNGPGEVSGSKDEDN